MRAFERVVHFNKLTYLGRRVWVFSRKGPRYHYTYARWRLGGWWRNKVARFYALDDATFFAQLGPHLLGVEKALDDYESAKSRLIEHFGTRTKPRFHYSWQDREKIASLVKDEQKEATIQAADEICQNTFRFRRAAPVRFKNEVDWSYCPKGNTDWMWDLNRHFYFITLGKAHWYTGDARYAQKFKELLLDWIDKNPAGVGKQNWDSVLEVAIRINTWIWAYFFFRQAKVFEQETHITFLKGLLTHAQYLSARIERHAANNHLLLEAKALAFCGLLFPEFREAKAWQKTGLQILWDEVKKQVCEDGVHAERAPLYHRCVLSEVLEMLALMDHNDWHVPRHVVERFKNMLDFEMNITKPDGTIPLFSDSALTDDLVRFTPRGGSTKLFEEIKLPGRGLDEEMAWLLGSWALNGNAAQAAEPAPPLTSQPFVQGGYFVMRAGEGEQALYLAFDCGPFGYKPVPYHGHADALSFELYAYGHSWLLDSGVYSYHLGEDWRNYFRGTQAHNTVVVDGQDQSMLLDARRVYRPAQATLHQWISSDHFDLVDGSHNGYERLAEPVTHRRQIFFVKPEYWVVIDSLTGRGKHCFDLYFHLMPGTDPQLESKSGSLCIGNRLEPGFFIAPLATNHLQNDIITGATSPIQGWISFFSGEKVPAPTLRYRQESIAPVQFCTVLYPYSSRMNVSVAVSALHLESKSHIDQNHLTGIRIETNSHVDYLMLDRGPAGAHKALADYETDAELLYVRHKKEDNSLEKVISKGGRQLAFQGQSLLETEEQVQNFSPESMKIL